FADAELAATCASFETLDFGHSRASARAPGVAASTSGNAVFFLTLAGSRNCTQTGPGCPPRLPPLQPGEPIKKAEKHQPRQASLSLPCRGTPKPCSKPPRP